MDNIPRLKQPFLYSVEREFPCGIETLWKAWTDASELEQWYHPTDLDSVKSATASDLRIGGLWSCAVSVPAHNFAAYFYGKYIAIDEMRFIEHTMLYTESAEEFAVKDMDKPSHVVTLDFEVRGKSSWVKFSQYGELPEGHVVRAQAGMESYLDSLSNFLNL